MSNPNVSAQSNIDQLRNSEPEILSRSEEGGDEESKLNLPPSQHQRTAGTVVDQARGQSRASRGDGVGHGYVRNNGRQRASH
jgi:hypothetical protein